MSRKKLPKNQSLHVLFADDEPDLQELVGDYLKRMGHTVVVCPDGLTAVAALQKESFDCMIVDLDMPGLNGMQVIEQASQLRPEMDCVVMTGKATKDSAIQAVRHRVFDYLTKPCRPPLLAEMLGRLSQQRSIKKQMAALQHRLRQAEGDSRLVGNAGAMDQVRKLIERVGPTESTVLIRGETGCGKELVARAVYDASLRAGNPMVSINCGALPENLIESELFGHCKGAFTGADSARMGLFEVADGGTIFLDEIGELPLAMQAKLLRVLETGDIRRLGDNQTVHVDVRVICATHRDLEQMVADEQFREDLMFRINTFEIDVPPLRQRLDDLMPLAVHLLRRHRSDGSDDGLFSEAAKSELLAHKWPGNVRELANVIEHAAILCDTLPIEPEHLPRHFSRRQVRAGLVDNTPMTLREIEAIAINRAMERHDGDKKAVAEELGIALKTLYNRINAGIQEAA